MSGRSTVVAALRSARADPEGGDPNRSSVPGRDCRRAHHLPVAGTRAWPAANRSTATRHCRLPLGDRSTGLTCRRARRPCPWGVRRHRPDHALACGVPSEGGCRRYRGNEPDTGMQDIRHVTSVLTRRRSGRAIRQSAIAPGIPNIRDALHSRWQPGRISCLYADSLRLCVALPAMNVPAS